MSRKFLTLLACTLLAAVAFSTPSYALTPGWYMVSICVSQSPVTCPAGPNPTWLGPYSTQAQCQTARALWVTGPLGTYPRSLSNCYLQS